MPNGSLAWWIGYGGWFARMAVWLWTIFCFTMFENEFITILANWWLVISNFKIKLLIDFFLTAVPGSHAGSRYLTWAFGFSATTRGIPCHNFVLQTFINFGTMLAVKTLSLPWSSRDFTNTSNTTFAMHFHDEFRRLWSVQFWPGLLARHDKYKRTKYQKKTMSHAEPNSQGLSRTFPRGSCACCSMIFLVFYVLV